MIHEKKIIISILISIIFCNGICAQIGINTDTPLSALDVNGSTNISGSLLIGGDDSTPGSAGLAKQLLISQGDGVAPVWQTVENFDLIVSEKWYLVGTITKIDDSGGLVLNSTYETGPIKYFNGFKLKEATDGNWNPISGSTNYQSKFWKEFDGMSFEIPASNKVTRLMINVQVPFQAYWNYNTSTTSQWISCVFGIFKEEQSVGGKKILSMAAETHMTARGTGPVNTPDGVITLISAIDIPATNTKTIYHLLGSRRNKQIYSTIDNTKLYMGADMNGSTSSGAILKRLTLRVDIFSATK